MKHFSMKKNYLRTNQERFMSKDLHQAIMKHFRLRNKFLSNRKKMS